LRELLNQGLEESSITAVQEVMHLTTYLTLLTLAPVILVVKPVGRCVDADESGSRR
jgi:hypothetical protein